MDLQGWLVDEQYGKVAPMRDPKRAYRSPAATFLLALSLLLASLLFTPLVVLITWAGPSTGLLAILLVLQLAMIGTLNTAPPSRLRSTKPLPQQTRDCVSVSQASKSYTDSPEMPSDENARVSQPSSERQAPE